MIITKCNPFIVEFLAHNTSDVIKIDAEDLEKVMLFKWCADKRYKHVQRFFHNGIKTIAVSIANEIMQDFGSIFDHKDRDPLNNKKDNLRIATFAQNTFNVSKRKGTTSKYKGVAFCQAKQKWQAYINIKRKRHHLGFFDKEEEAASTYDKRAVEYYGEFAVLNIK